MTCPLVLITWRDSGQPLPSWHYLSSLPKAGPIECATSGWLLKDDPDVKVIAQTIGDLSGTANAQAMGIMSIPASAIKSIVHLEETAELPVKRLEAAE